MAAGDIARLRMPDGPRVSERGLTFQRRSMASRHTSHAFGHQRPAGAERANCPEKHSWRRRWAPRASEGARPTRRSASPPGPRTPGARDASLPSPVGGSSWPVHGSRRTAASPTPVVRSSAARVTTTQSCAGLNPLRLPRDGRAASSGSAEIEARLLDDVCEGLDDRASNCVPAQRRSSAAASATLMA
jgi:hypothetical protein